MLEYRTSPHSFSGFGRTETSFSAREPKANEENWRELMALYEAGKIDPLVGDVFPLSEYAPALRRLSGRAAIGKVVLGTGA